MPKPVDLWIRFSTVRQDIVPRLYFMDAILHERILCHKAYSFIKAILQFWIFCQSLYFMDVILHERIFCQSLKSYKGDSPFLDIVLKPAFFMDAILHERIFCQSL